MTRAHPTTCIETASPTLRGDPINRAIDEMLAHETDDVRWLMNVKIPPSDEAMQRDFGGRGK